MTSASVTHHHQPAPGCHQQVPGEAQKISEHQKISAPPCPPAPCALVVTAPMWCGGGQCGGQRSSPCPRGPLQLDYCDTAPARALYLLILHIAMSSCQGQGCGGTLLLVLHGARSMCDVWSRNTAAVEVLRSMNRLHHSPHQPRARPQTPAPSRTTAVKCGSHLLLQLHNITSHHSVIFPCFLRPGIF